MCNKEYDHESLDWLAAQDYAAYYGGEPEDWMPTEDEEDEEEVKSIIK